MSLSQLAIIEDYHSLEVSRTTYPNYKYYCVKYNLSTKDNITLI